MCAKNKQIVSKLTPTAGESDSTVGAASAAIQVTGVYHLQLKQLLP